MENKELSKEFMVSLFWGKVCSEHQAKLKLALKQWGMCDETREIIKNAIKKYMQKIFRFCNKLSTGNNFEIVDVLF
jgi:hypothetical protein